MIAVMKMVSVLITSFGKSEFQQGALIRGREL